jgi:crossover junction endodeoxyribonuclease RusA
MNVETLHLTLTFYAPTKRAFDLDNALARIKSGLDGLADVLGVDDSRWSLTIRKGDTVGGFVRVEVA